MLQLPALAGKLCQDGSSINYTAVLGYLHPIPVSWLDFSIKKRKFIY